MEKIYVVNKICEGCILSVEKAFILKSDAEKYAENMRIKYTKEPDFLSEDLDAAILDLDSKIEDFDCDYYETLMVGLNKLGYNLTKEQIEQYLNWFDSAICDFIINEIELVK